MFTCRFRGARGSQLCGTEGGTRGLPRIGAQYQPPRRRQPLRREPRRRDSDGVSAVRLLEAGPGTATRRRADAHAGLHLLSDEEIRRPGAVAAGSASCRAAQARAARVRPDWWSRRWAARPSPAGAMERARGAGRCAAADAEGEDGLSVRRRGNSQESGGRSLVACEAFYTRDAVVSVSFGFRTGGWFGFLSRGPARHVSSNFKIRNLFAYIWLYAFHDTMMTSNSRKKY